jgi:hypothetical protein
MLVGTVPFDPCVVVVATPVPKVSRVAMVLNAFATPVAASAVFELEM